MTSCSDESNPNKYLLVWPMPIPDEVRALFTVVFIGIYEMFKYICEVLTKTDTFYLIIPSDFLALLLRDPVYRFPQVVRIDVICDSLNQLRRIEPSFLYGLGKIKLYTINNLLKLWDQVLLGRALVSSSSANEMIKAGIIFMIQARISAKQSNTFSARSHIAKQLRTAALHGFPVKNIGDFPSCYVCPSCKLVYECAYQLSCGHRQCKACANIQKNCTICSEDILRDKVMESQSLQMEMQDLQTHCSHCDHVQPWKDYELHLKGNHSELITPFISVHEVDEDRMFTSTNGECIWEISKIDKLKADAIAGRQKSVYSPSFYLFPNGYKMCLRLFVNGDGKAKGTHMSLFFVIMRGEHDEKLQWPFKFKATFSLIDQSITVEKQNYVSPPCRPNFIAECLKQPNTSMNDGFGISMCIPLELFQTSPSRFIKNDTLYIQFAIDLTAETPSINDVGESPNDEVHVDTADSDISDQILSFQ